MQIKIQIGEKANFPGNCVLVINTQKYTPKLTQTLKVNESHQEIKFATNFGFANVSIKVENFACRGLPSHQFQTLTGDFTWLLLLLIWGVTYQTTLENDLYSKKQ